MGYSIWVTTRGQKKFDKMVKFMEDNYVEPNNLFSVKSDLCGSHGPTTDVGYDCKRGIGFDYSSWVHDLERTYIFAVTKWMANKIGTSKKFKGESLKYYLYDEEALPVNDTKLGWVVPDHGDSMKHREILSIGYSYDNLNLILDELKRLDKLWENKDG